MTLFPLIDAPAETAGSSTAVLPLYREVAWDFEQDVPVWQGGNPKWGTGA